MKKRPDFLIKREITQGDALIRIWGRGGTPCLAIEPSKRKTKVRFSDGKEEWLPNEQLFIIEDVVLKARILER